jgi:large repetitive protein
MHAPRRARLALFVVLSLLGACLLPQPAAAILDGGLNAPPEAVDDAINTAEGTPGDVNVLANDTDPDGDMLTILSWTQATHGAVVCVLTDCVYTPTDIGFSGSDSFTYTITDGLGGTDVGLVLVTVTPTNEQPVAADDALSTTEDTPGSVDVLLNDTDDDGDALVVETLSPPADHGTVSCAWSGTCTYTPDPDFEGTDTFTYSISDGQGGADSGDVAVTVTPVNDDPVAVDDSLSTVEDQQASLNVRANDTDVDGDTLLVTTPAPAAAHGTVSCLGGGACTYTPDPGYNGPDSFQYTISDGHGGTDTGTVNVTVTPGNTAPVADDDALATAEDAPNSVNVLVGDTDFDDDPLTVTTLAPAAANGTVACSSAGTCTYTPDADYSGSDSFEYTVSDGRGGSDVGLVSVTVTPANDPPVAVDDSLTTAEDTQAQVDVLANDTDVDGGAPSVTGSTNGVHGIVSCDPAGTCAYTPAANYSGADTFSYTVSDGNGGTDTGSVSVSVTPENDAPVADDDALTTQVDTQGAVNVLAGDTDVDGDTLTIDATSDPDHGSVACNPTTGVCTYTPDAAYVGPDSFTYTVGDGQATDQGLVSVTVEEANTPPGCAGAKPSKTKLWPPRHQLVLIALSGASDADGDPLTYAITSVTQDEKTTKTGPGDKRPDAQRVPGKPNQIKLRAERAPKANGRVYRVFYTVSDGRGGTCSGVEKVGVPVKRGKNAVETAKSFNSFG